ncbi:MAG: (d)CMP kinase [Oscillospiraceae bacterium]
MKNISIAIDGPSGAGKSTLARMTARHFGLIYIDTGAIYRSVGLFVLRSGVASKDETAVSALLPQIDIEIRHDETGMQRMFLNGEDVSDAIRLPEVSIYASNVSAMPAVRRALMGMQRGIAEKSSVIMDGRDIGTVVLPNADLKIFLTASSEERAKRRYAELCEKNIKADYYDVLRDIEYRDKNDSTRKEAPLRAADDAVMLDTTGNSLEKSFALIKKTVEERLCL